MLNWRFGFGGLDSWDPLLKAIVTPPRIPNQQPKRTINHYRLLEISQKKQLWDMIFSCGRQKQLSKEVWRETERWCRPELEGECTTPTTGEQSDSKGIPPKSLNSDLGIIVICPDNKLIVWRVWYCFLWLQTRCFVASNSFYWFGCFGEWWSTFYQSLSR